jgi:23S rRNA pseudouridine1911/1915/1917 synthase
MTQHFVIEPPHHLQRLDKTLAELLPELSRTQAGRLIADGQVTVAGAVCCHVSQKVQTGQEIAVTIPAAVPLELTAVAMPLDILFEDEHLLVVNKPAGLTVHPAVSEQGVTLVHALLHHCGASLSGIGGVQRPGIVHRLDKDTSGAMLVAKHDAAHQHLSAQLADRSLSRLYHALVFGFPKPSQGVWEGNIGRSPQNRKKMAVVATGGKTARSHYKTLETFGNSALSLVECKLETGRTHQIRVHFSHYGYPLVGDPLYGRGRKLHDANLQRLTTAFPRQALHAVAVSFIHPATGESHHYEAAYPDDFASLYADLQKK